MKTIFLSLSFYLVSFICCYAGTILDNVPDDRYINYGKNIDCVVQMLGYTDNKLTSMFSGVIIDKNWIITSAHTMNKKEKFVFKLKNNTISIDEYFIHPKYDSSKFGSMDVALCHIKQDIEIDFIPKLYKDNDELGKICCIVGYGSTGTGLTGANKWDNIKRAGSNRVELIINNLLLCDMSNKDKNCTELEFCITPGDSGGGLFIDKKLAGINSCVLHKDKTIKGKYTDDTGHVRISSKECIEWIEYIIYE